jgi:hypothetical protein
VLKEGCVWVDEPSHCLHVAALVDVRLLRHATCPHALTCSHTHAHTNTTQTRYVRRRYLHKTKWTSSRLVSLKSTKLRYFVLKQNPDTYVSRFEYYEGLILKGALEMVSDHPLCLGAFSHARDSTEPLRPLLSPSF